MPHTRWDIPPPVFEPLEPRTLFAATPVGEAGAVTLTQANASSWTTVPLYRGYTNPVVVATAQTANDPEPFTVRIRNVTSASFELQLDEWEYLDGMRATPETVGYFVVEAGTHTLDDGTLVQAGFASVDSTVSTVTLPSAHGSAPVVLTQVSSVNEDEAVVPRPRSVGMGSFQVELQEQEPAKGPHVAETLGWISIDAVAGATGGWPFEAGLTPDSVTDVTYGVSFGAPFASTPVVLAGMQSADGGDTAATHVSSRSAAGFDVFLQEEQAGDAETSHTTETVGYVALVAGLLNLGPDMPPVVIDDAYATAEDVPLSVSSGGGVLINDADPESGPLTAVLLTTPSQGMVVLNADGSFVYTPNANASGVDSFTYQAVDLAGSATTGTVTVTVSEQNDPPVAGNDAFNTDEDVALAGSVVGGDVDVDGDPLTYTLLTPPAQGTLTLDDAGNFLYTPNVDANGIDAWVYRVDDGRGGADTATVNLTVNPVNDAPRIAMLPAAGMGFDGRGEFAVELSDVDAGTSVLTIDLLAIDATVTLPDVSALTMLIGDGTDDAFIRAQGTLTQINQGLSALEVQVNQGAGRADLRLTVDDGGASGSGGALTAEVTWTVSPPPLPYEPPLATPPAGLGVHVGDPPESPGSANNVRQRFDRAATPPPPAAPIGHAPQRTLIAWPEGVWLANAKADQADGPDPFAEAAAMDESKASRAFLPADAIRTDRAAAGESLPRITAEATSTPNRNDEPLPESEHTKPGPQPEVLSEHPGAEGGFGVAVQGAAAWAAVAWTWLGRRKRRRAKRSVTMAE